MASEPDSVSEHDEPGEHDQPTGEHHETTGELSQIVQSVVEPYLLGGPRRYNRADVAQRSGVSPELSRRLWVSLGFPADPDANAVEYTDADVAALRAFTGLDFTDKADDRVQVTAARTLGQAMARLAEWQLDLVADEILGRIAVARESAGDVDIAHIAREATERTVTVLQDLQDYAWRRHLAVVLARSIDAGPSAANATKALTVGFADMVGYTRLTRHLHPDELAALLEAFETTTTEAITENGGWVIKNVGDEVMFAAESQEAGARIALSIQETTMVVGETPELRVGLAYGPVLQRFGDLYGSVVNIAARLTGVARPGTVLVDDQMAAALADNLHFSIRHLRSVRVRGFSRLRSHVLRRGSKSA